MNELCSSGSWVVRASAAVARVRSKCIISIASCEILSVQQQSMVELPEDRRDPLQCVYPSANLFFLELEK